MATPLNVLIVDGSAQDAFLTERALRKGGYEPQCRRVDTQGLVEALRRKPWDVLLCESDFPSLTMPIVVGRVQLESPSLPVVLVSGRRPEELEHLLRAYPIRAMLPKDHLGDLAALLASLLPSARRGTIQMPAERSAGPWPGAAACRRKTHLHPTVLIVDDNQDVRDGFALYLSRHGYSVETAADGADALEKMQRAHPCIIVLDLAMPGMTGMGLRALQVADPELGAIPVVICSALGGAREIAEGLGSAAFLQKPVAMPDLAAAVSQHCLK